MAHDEHHGPPKKVAPKEVPNMWAVGKQLPMTHKQWLKATRNWPFTVVHFKVMWPWIFSFTTVFSFFAYKFNPVRLNPEGYKTSLYLKQLEERGISYPLSYEQLVHMHRARDELKKGLPVLPLPTDLFKVEIPDLSLAYFLPDKSKLPEGLPEGYLKNFPGSTSKPRPVPTKEQLEELERLIKLTPLKDVNSISSLDVKSTISPETFQQPPVNIQYDTTSAGNDLKGTEWKHSFFFRPIQRAPRPTSQIYCQIRSSTCIWFA